jgi:hypothetical protein
VIAVFAPLIAWAFWIGLNPQPYFRVLERPVAKSWSACGRVITRSGAW